VVEQLIDAHHFTGMISEIQQQAQSARIHANALPIAGHLR